MGLFGAPYKWSYKPTYVAGMGPPCRKTWIKLKPSGFEEETLPDETHHVIRHVSPHIEVSEYTYTYFNFQYLRRGRE